MEEAVDAGGGGPYPDVRVYSSVLSTLAAATVALEEDEGAAAVVQGKEEEEGGGGKGEQEKGERGAWGGRVTLCGGGGVRIALELLSEMPSKVLSLLALLVQKYNY
jgi:hypothetical protein